MISFMQAHSRPVTSVQEYLDSQAGSPLKYSPKKGEVARLYFPFMDQVVMENGQQVVKRGLCSYALATHDIKMSANDYKLVPCLKLDQPVIDPATGNTIYSGQCPYCERVNDARAIVDYRVEKERERMMSQGMTADAIENQIKNLSTSFRSEQKIGYAKQRLYVLVAKFVLNSKNQPEMDQETGLPAYEFKIMRLSPSQLEDIQKAVNQLALTTGVPQGELAGSEMIITYGDSDDKRHVVGDAQYMAVPVSTALTAITPTLMEKIQAEATQFNWDDIVKPYPEFQGVSEETAKSDVARALRLWDEYQTKLAAGEPAVYGEYGVSSNNSYPALGAGQQASAPTQGPGVPQNMQGALPNFGQAPSFGAQGFGSVPQGFTPAPNGFAGQEPAQQAPAHSAGQTQAQQMNQQVTQQAPMNNYGFQPIPGAGTGENAPAPGTPNSFGEAQMTPPWGGIPNGVQ